MATTKQRTPKKMARSSGASARKSAAPAKKAPAKSATKSPRSSGATAVAPPPPKPRLFIPPPPMQEAPPAPDISPLTGLPLRSKIHLPIKGYGRLNAFQVLENLYGHSVKDLQKILEYEEKHQARRMVIDRINDMVKRARS